jgi:hypothetical protein
LSIWLFECLFFYLNVCLSILMSVCLFVCMFTCLFVCLSACPIVCLFDCVFLCLTAYMSFCLYVWVSNSLSAGLYICVPICHQRVQWVHRWTLTTYFHDGYGDPFYDVPSTISSKVFFLNLFVYLSVCWFVC